ncbi:hypothetical protein [Paraburkholderia sp. SIMBA_030]|uniref:hypothetical protein n=1 Tax=Paraburkholderia sp. SIMBA_030 TaxID=3085773 RepID=UPI00397A049E
MSDPANNNNPTDNRIGAIEVGKLIWNSAAASVEWVGGALAGEFSQKQTAGQIVFDAVISMFPVLGEGTAARDAIAICLGMCDDRQKAEDRWQWIRLVLCLIAVVPLLGGVLKGVGRLVVRALEKSENLEKLAAEIVLFLNRMGRGNAYEWLRQLDFTRYQGAVAGALTELLDRLTRASQYIVRNMGGVLPPAVRQYLAALPPKLQEIGRLANRMVPQALKDLNDCLVRMRAHLVEGTWADITVGAGNVTTREAEGRLATMARDGGKIAHPPATLASYQHKEGWLDLSTGRNVATDKETGDDIFTTIESFSRDKPIVADTIHPGRAMLARVIDSARHKSIPPRTKVSNYWLPGLPKNGREWRENWAVVQEWNHNGAYVQLTHIPTADELRAAGVVVPPGWEGLRVWRGQVSSQYDAELGRYLAGGETQLVIDFDHPHNAVLREYVRTLMAQPTRWTDVMFGSSERAAVRAMEPHELAPKTVPQGYTTRAPAAVSRGVPDRTSAEQQH